MFSMNNVSESTTVFVMVVVSQLKAPIFTEIFNIVYSRISWIENKVEKKRVCCVIPDEQLGIIFPFSIMIKK